MRERGRGGSTSCPAYCKRSTFPGLVKPGLGEMDGIFRSRGDFPQEGDASPSHPAPFNSVHCVHFIPAPIPRIFRILGETLRILRTQRVRLSIKPKP
ncbi:hypothetical protein JOQ06_002201, partial [Pogonophryne albipinna]